MSDSAAILAELRALRGDIADLATRVGELEQAQGNQTDTGDNQVTISYSVTGSPETIGVGATPALAVVGGAAASSQPPVAPDLQRPPGNFRLGAVYYSAAERREIAEGAGRFIKRSLNGDHRGTSGRERLRLQSRIYVLFRDHSGRCYNPVRVFETFSALQPLVKPRGDPGDSIFIGFPTKWEAKICSEEAGEIATVAIILLAEVGGRLVALLPHRAWNRAISKRLIPNHYFLKPTAVDVLVCDRTLGDESGAHRRRVWMGVISPEAEEKILFDIEAFHPIEPDLYFDTAGPNYLPTATDLARLAERHYGFASATSGAGEPDLGARLQVLEASVQSIAESLKKLHTAPAAPLPARKPALKPSAKPGIRPPAEAASSTWTPPPPGLGEIQSHLDLDVVRAARQAGIPEDQIVEMAQLAAQGKPKLSDFPMPSRPPTTTNPLSETDEEEELQVEAGQGSGGGSQDAALAAAITKLTEISSHLATQKKKEGTLDALLDAGAAGPGESGGVPTTRKYAAALRALRRTWQRNPEELYKAMESNMAADFMMQAQLPGSQAVPVSARAWLELRSRVQGYATPVRLLWGVAGILDSLRIGNHAEARARACLILAQGDQLSIDRGSWLGAGGARSMPIPFQETPRPRTLG
eukprot:Skav210874  [mRNA]  locus=scaffold1173:118408:120490:+ [translate_table: standard]